MERLPQTCYAAPATVKKVQPVFARLKPYYPVIVITKMAALAAAALAWGELWFDWGYWMQIFMGLFLVIFAMFKFFDLPGFAKGFKKYDVITQKLPAYGFAYPYIEMALGLMLLADWNTTIAFWGALVVSLATLYGVLKSLRAGMDVRCACLGTMLNVPLSTVTVVENAGMALMSAIMLLCM